MENYPKACFCRPGMMIFRHDISFKDQGAVSGYTASTLSSPNFPVAWNHQWYIEVEGNPSYVYVKQVSYGKSPIATFYIKIAGLAPITLEWPAGQPTSMSKMFPNKGNFRSVMSNYTLFMNVILTVPLTAENAHLAKNTCSEFCEQFKTLFGNQLASDVTIVPSSGQLSAHWSVLVARSPFFSVMMTSDFKEKEENKVVIDLSYKTCKQMIEFIYSNQITITEEEDGRELLRAGDIYFVDGLKVAAEDFLCSHLTASNALELLMLSHVHKAINLKKKALDFISGDLKSATEHERYPEFLKHSDLVTELLSHMCSKKTVA